MPKVVHLAGNTVVIGERAIQRCLICGAKLADNLGAMAPVNEDGTTPAFPTWEVGAWVEHDGNRWSVVGQSDAPVMEPFAAPDNCCLASMPRQADEQLRNVAQALERIVIPEGEDAGVILLSDESPSRYDADLKCHVYLHENFSPLGDALVNAWKIATGADQ